MPTVHLAVMKPGPLRRLLAGEKRIEARFSKVRCAPHGRVREGDRIVFKESGGPVRAMARAAAVATWHLDGPEAVEEIRRLYQQWIVADAEYWEAKRSARWATLIVLEAVEAVSPFAVEKRDRQPWVVNWRNPGVTEG